MEIKAVQSISTWSDKGSESDSKDKSLAAKGKFSTMLRQLETGDPITDTGEKPGEDTTTVTRVMSDGSVLVTVYEKDKIVAQTKTHSPHPEEIPTILSTRVETSLPSTAAACGTALWAHHSALMFFMTPMNDSLYTLKAVSPPCPTVGVARMFFWSSSSRSWMQMGASFPHYTPASIPALKGKKSFS